jgi:hypothetical protein
MRTSSWRHLRTSNAIESSFATVKLHTRVTKGAGSRKAALAMAYKLLDAASERWRRFNGHELVADVLAGATFKDGQRVTDDENTTDERSESVSGHQYVHELPTGSIRPDGSRSVADASATGREPSVSR